MATPDSFDYKGWRVLVANETGCGFMASAHRGTTHLYVDVQRGRGAKAEAARLIQLKIDQQPTA